MKRTLEDFENEYNKKQTILDNKFFQDFGFSSQSVTRIGNIIGNNPFMQQLYEQGKLYIGSKYRGNIQNISDNLDYLEQSSPKRLTKRARIQEEYDINQKMETLVKSAMEAVQSYKDRTDLAARYNSETVSQLLQEELNFAISIELFPEIDVSDPGTDKAEVSRSDSYDPNFKLIEFCPKNFNGTNIPPRNSPSELFAHELAHAIDDLQGDRSIDVLKDTIDKYYPGPRDQSVINEINKNLEASSLLCSKDIWDLYDIHNIIDSNGHFNSDVDAAAEFVSFRAEKIVDILNKSQNKGEFATKYGAYIDQQMKLINDLGVGLKGNLFSLDVANSTSKAYFEKIGANNPGIKEVLDEVSKITEQVTKNVQTEMLEEMKDKGIKAAEDGLGDLESLIQEKMEAISDLTQKAVELGVKAEDLSSLEELGAELDGFRGKVKEYSKTVEDLKAKDFSKTTLNELNQKITNFSEELSKLSTSVDTNVVDLDISQEVREGIKTEIDALNKVSEEWVEKTKEVEKSFEDAREYEEWLPEE